jgi:hypothetical protein
VIFWSAEAQWIRAIVADLAEQARGEFVAGAGQRTKEVVIW